MDTQNDQTNTETNREDRINHLEGFLKEHTGRWPTISDNTRISTYEELAELYSESDNPDDLTEAAKYFEYTASNTAPLKVIQIMTGAEPIRDRKALFAKSAKLYAEVGNFKRASRNYGKASSSLSFLTI